MADSAVVVTAGTGTNIDTRTEATNGNHRQVVVLGDPSTNAGVAPVDATAGLKVDLGADNDVTVTGNVAVTNAGITTIAGAVSGTEMQVDVLTLPAIPAGTNNIGDVDVLSVVPGTGATNLGKAIDTATGATDTGVLALATRDDALSALTPIEGDNVQLRTDANGALWVKPSGTVTVDGSGVTQPVSHGALTELAAAINASSQVDVNIAASSATVPISHTALTELAAAINASSQLDVNIAAGSAAGTEYTEDAAAAANPAGGALILVREDARAGGLTTADGDNVALRGNNKGEAYVKDTDAAALLTTIDTDTSNLSTKIDTLAGAVAGTEMQVDIVAAIPAGTNNIGDVDVLTVPADPFGANADAAATAGSTGSIQAKLRLLTSQLDAVKTAVETLDNAIAGSEMQVDVVGALPAGTNAIGKLAANSGVDIGDVDVLTINGVAPAFGTGVRGATVQRVTIATDDIVPASQSGTWTVQPGNTANTTPWLITDTPATTGGLSTFHLVGAATNNATNVKASAGQVYSITAFNLSASPRYLKFHNTAGTPTAGSGVVRTVLIPGNTAGAGAVINIDKGLAFSTGIGISIVTGIADSDTTAIGASEVVVDIGYK